MKKEYQEIYENQTCPIDDRKAVHTVWLAKSTCTRFPDDVLDFSCNLNQDCKQCMDNYP